MNPFFEYLLKSSLSLTLFYIVFKLAVSRDKMHAVNRFVLLGILIGSTLLPFADIPIIQEAEIIPTVEVFREFVAQPVFKSTAISENIEVVQQTKSIQINWYLIFYLSIISALIIRLLISVIRVLQIIKRAEKQRFQKIILAVVKDFIQPFSFLKNIIISEKDYTENREIVVAHEYAHIKHLHAIDLIFCELLTALQWFNPFMWFLRRDLKLQHEFQADQAVLNKGIDAKKYQLLVLQKSVGERRFALANNFSQKPILKRLKMMQKKNRNRWKGMKLILFIPIVLLLLQAFSEPKILKEKVNELVPDLIQKDSSDVWLDNWTIENIKNINGGILTEEFEIAPPPPGYPKTNLPKYDKSRNGHPIATNNTLTILINRKNQILASEKLVESEELLKGVENFLKGNPAFKEIKKGPELVETNLPGIGNVNVSKGVIILRHDIETSKDFMEKLLRSIGKVHLEAREKIASEKFNQNYFSLSADKKNLINQMIPIRVSIMEPKVVKPPPPPPPNIIGLTLKKDGVVIFGKNEYSISEMEQKITEVKSERAKMYKKWGLNPDLVVNLKVEIGVSESQISSLKEVFRKAEIRNINYSSEKKELELNEIKPPPPPPPPPIFKVNLYKENISVWGDFIQAKDEEAVIKKVGEKAETFLKKAKGKYSVTVYVEDGVTEERYHKLNNELIRVGMGQITYRDMN